METLTIKHTFDAQLRAIHCRRHIDCTRYLNIVHIIQTCIVGKRIQTRKTNTWQRLGSTETTTRLEYTWIRGKHRQSACTTTKQIHNLCYSETWRGVATLKHSKVIDLELRVQHTTQPHMNTTHMKESSTCCAGRVSSMWSFRHNRRYTITTTKSENIQN